MLYSGDQLHAFLSNTEWPFSYSRNDLNYNTTGYVDRAPTLAQCRTLMRHVKAAICDRSGGRCANIDRLPERHRYNIELGKFARPWDVLPELQNFSVPDGDFGVGVEVEHGFVTPTSATFIANAVRRWKHICIDSEGGTNGLEVTFPPELLSKMNSKSKCFRYVKLLAAHPNRLHRHGPNSSVGTHINVSKGGHTCYLEYMRMYRILEDLSPDAKQRYFGRSRPYGYVRSQDHYYEFKMFNSVPDVIAMRRYINVAVALTTLLTQEDQGYNRQTVLDALEAAYLKG